MQYDMTDKEQKEQVVKVLREYGIPVAVAVVIGLAGSYGYRMWQQNKMVAQQNASNLFAAMQVATMQKNTAKLTNFAQQLTAKYPKSNYASLGQLLLARELAGASNYSKAATALQWVIANAKQPVAVDMAKLSLSGVYLDQKQSAQALSALNGVSATMQPLVLQQKALIYTQMQQPDKAVGYLQQAQQAFTAANLPRAAVMQSMLLAQFPTKK